MTLRARLEVALAAMAVALSGCGGASQTTTSHRPSTATTTASAVSSTTQTAASTVKKRRQKRDRSGPRVAAKATTTTTTTSTTGSVRTAPPPTPAGTPVAPSGLVPTTGYGTYELCSTRCGGAVPAALRRPLHLPRAGVGGPCPLSAAHGPVRPLGSARLTIAPFIGSGWKGGRVTWVSTLGYSGPVLARGRQLGGPGAVGFGEGRRPYDELQLLAPGSNAPSVPGAGRAWVSFVRVRGPGCYAYQVDGTSFSDVIVFRAAG